MIVNRFVKAGFTDTHVRVGRYVSMLRCDNGTRLTLLKNGRRIFESEFSQGMSLSDIDYDEVAIYSESEQKVDIWLSNVKFNAEPQASERPASFKCYRKAIGHGVNKLLEKEPSRTLVRMSADRDFFLGGDNMEFVSGNILNARKYTAGQEVEFTSYGELYCWWTDFVETELHEAPPLNDLKYIPWNFKFYDRTNTELTNLGVYFFDFTIPDELDNVPFDLIFYLDAISIQPTENEQFSVFLHHTIGDSASEPLEAVGVHDIYGGVSKAYKVTVSVSMTKGTHRFFVSSSSTTGMSNPVEGDSGGFESLVKVATSEPLLADVAIFEVLEERM